MHSPDSDSPAPANPPILSVSALNQAVARTLERSFPLLWVSGEVSNFTRAASGHWYFTLKDAGAQVRAVMFRGRAQYSDFIPREGDKIEVRTLVTLYAPRGDYQLNVESMRRAGVGNLYEAFLALKEKLRIEGLLEAQRKRALPPFVKTIGIVTSLQAAALRDVLTTLQRRAPHVHIILYPSPVQGDAAALKIAQAIATASARAECEVLLLCRGGGSIEDLWSFNDETVARTIAECSMPVIVGVGHETDFTIADFVADLRAPTPTAAAELATPARTDWIAALNNRAENLNRLLQRRLAEHAQTLDWLARRLLSPARYVAHERMKLQGLQVRLAHALSTPLAQARFALTHAGNRLARQLPDTLAQRQSLINLERRLGAQMRSRSVQQRQALAARSAQLAMLNPQRTLERGYAIIVDQHGEIVRTPQQIRAGQALEVTLAQGRVQIEVAGVAPRE